MFPNFSLAKNSVSYYLGWFLFVSGAPYSVYPKSLSLRFVANCVPQRRETRLAEEILTNSS